MAALSTLSQHDSSTGSSVSSWVTSLDHRGAAGTRHKCFIMGPLGFRQEAGKSYLL